MAKNESKILSPDALADIISSGKAETLVFFGEEDYLKTVWTERIAKAVMTAEGFDVFNRFSVRRISRVGQPFVHLSPPRVVCGKGGFGIAEFL